MPASPPSAERRRGDAGYTMIEMIVVIAIAGTLMAAAVSGWQTWLGRGVAGPARLSRGTTPAGRAPRPSRPGPR